MQEALVAQSSLEALLYSHSYREIGLSRRAQVGLLLWIHLPGVGQRSVNDAWLQSTSSIQVYKNITSKCEDDLDKRNLKKLKYMLLLRY